MKIRRQDELFIICKKCGTKFKISQHWCVKNCCLNCGKDNKGQPILHKEVWVDLPSEITIEGAEKK